MALGSSRIDGISPHSSMVPGQFPIIQGPYPLNFGPGELTKVVTNEANNCPASTSVDLLNISNVGPGYVELFWLALAPFSSGGSINTIRDSTIQVFIDGESSASISADLNGLFLAHTNDNSSSLFTKANCAHVGVELGVGATSGLGMSGEFRYPIPFKNSCHIQFTASAASTNTNVYSQVYYRTGIPHLGYKLFSNCTTYATGITSGSAITNGTSVSDAAMGSGSTQLTSATAAFTSANLNQPILVGGAPAAPETILGTYITQVVNGTTVNLALPNSSGGAISGQTIVFSSSSTKSTANGQTVFLNLPSGAGNSGFVVWHGATFLGTSAINFLETNLVAYIDGQTPLVGGVAAINGGTIAKFDNSGTEDYFGSSFYFMEALANPMQNASMMLTDINTSSFRVTVGRDHLASVGGLPFNDGILMRWEQGPRATPGPALSSVKCAWCILYYMPY